MERTLSQRLAQWAVGLRDGALPPKTASRFALHLLDTLGCGYGALRKGAYVNVVGLAMPLASGPGASILSRSGAFNAEDAAFINGSLFHALDFDDTHGPSVCHASSVVLAAGLAVAETVGLAGQDLLLACAAGVEAISRLGMADHNAFHLKGFHPSSVVGVFGSSITAGVLLHLNEREMANALGIAGSLASGLFAYLDGDSNPKPVHIGQAARNGIVAARLAKAGVTGPATIFESRFGLYGAFLGSTENNLPKLLNSLGDIWECGRMSIKPYPACHSMHACLDSAAFLQSVHGFCLNDVASIHAFLASERDVNLVMEPLEVKWHPTSPTVGKFSLPYSISSLICDHGLGIDSYDEAAMKRADVLALAKKVSYSRKVFPTVGKTLPGGIEIKLVSGEKYCREMLNERGGPANPLSDGQIEAKFRSNLGNAVEETWQDFVVQRFRGLPRDDQPVLHDLVIPEHDGRHAS